MGLRKRKPMTKKGMIRAAKKILLYCRPYEEYVLISRKEAVMLSKLHGVDGEVMWRMTDGDLYID